MTKRDEDPIRKAVFDEVMTKHAGRKGLRAHMSPEAIRIVGEYDGPVILGQHEDVPMRDRDGNPIQAAPWKPLDFGGGPMPLELFDMMEMLPAFDGEFATIMSDPRDPKDAEMEELIAEGWRFANDRSTFAPQAMAYYGDIPDEVIAEAKRKERERDAASGKVWEHVDGIRSADDGEFVEVRTKPVKRDPHGRAVDLRTMDPAEAEDLHDALVEAFEDHGDDDSASIDTTELLLRGESGVRIMQSLAQLNAPVDRSFINGGLVDGIRSDGEESS